MAQSVKKTVEENNKQIDELRDQLDSKLSREEGSRLWGNFSRFAVYDDLKELYQRCLPAISKFEDQLQDFVTDSAKLKLVVRRFDEVISTKVSKFQLAEFQTTVETEYALKADVAERDMARKGEVKAITKTTDDTKELVNF